MTSNTPRGAHRRRGGGRGDLGWEERTLLPFGEYQWQDRIKPVLKVYG